MRIKNDFGEKIRAEKRTLFFALNRKTVKFVFLHKNKYVSTVCLCINVPIPCVGLCVEIEERKINYIPIAVC